jgi:hypothetical protein
MAAYTGSGGEKKAIMKIMVKIAGESLGVTCRQAISKESKDAATTMAAWHGGQAWRGVDDSMLMDAQRKISKMVEKNKHQQWQR